MSYKDLFTITKPTTTFPPAARTASANGSSADRKFNESAIVVLNVGVWTDGTFTFALQESDDDTTFTAVSASQIQGALPVVSDATTNNTSFHIGYLGNKRYLRLAVTAAGTTTGAIFGATIIEDFPRFSGASQLA